MKEVAVPEVEESGVMFNSSKEGGWNKRSCPGRLEGGEK